MTSEPPSASPPATTPGSDAADAAAAGAAGPPPDAGAETLVISKTPGAFAPRAGVRAMSWEAAQTGGHRAFGRYSRLIAFPAGFPPSLEGGHQREAMRLRLREAVSGGALAVLLVPPSTQPVNVVDDEWNHARFVAEEASRMGVVRIAKAPESPWKTSTAGIPAIVAHLEAHPAGYRLEAMGELRRGGDPDDDMRVILAEAGGDPGDPYAVAGFPGRGAYIVLPWSREAVDDRDVEALMAVLDDLASLRESERGRREKAIKEIAIQANAAAAPPPVAATRPRAGRRPATRPAPVGALKGSALYVVPVFGNRGFLQHIPPGVPRARVSFMLNAGPFALATCLLLERRFRPGAASEVSVKELSEALKEAAVPYDNASSIRSYLSKVKGALLEALGPACPKGPLRIDRGSASVSLQSLQRALSPLGGTRIASVIDRYDAGIGLDEGDLE